MRLKLAHPFFFLMSGIERFFSFTELKQFFGHPRFVAVCILQLVCFYLSTRTKCLQEVLMELPKFKIYIIRLNKKRNIIKMSP